MGSSATRLKTMKLQQLTTLQVEVIDNEQGLAEEAGERDHSKDDDTTMEDAAVAAGKLRPFANALIPFLDRARRHSTPPLLEIHSLSSNVSQPHLYQPSIAQDSTSTLTGPQYVLRSIHSRQRSIFALAAPNILDTARNTNPLFSTVRPNCRFASEYTNPMMVKLARERASAGVLLSKHHHND